MLNLTLSGQPDLAMHHLAVWGDQDPNFSPAGAEGFKRDDPNATVKFYNTGHFALETNCNEIGGDIMEFLEKLPR